MNQNGNYGQSQGPGVDEIFEKWWKKVEEKFSGGGSRGGGGSPPSPAGSAKLILGVLLLIIFIYGALTSFYTVEPKEEAVVLRFGKYVSTTSPGLHFKFPFGIDQVEKLPTRLVLQQEFGFRTRGTQGNRTVYDKQQYDRESQMLTGDLNVADVEWVVQFQIADPKKFLFHVREPVKNIRDVAESIMRRVVGDRLVSEVLTTGRVEIATEAEQLMQEVLDVYDFGIKVVSVKLQGVNPPEVVKPSFNDVNSAKQEQEQLINQAEKEYNKVIPEARGKAEETIAQAKGYAEALVNRAKGDAEKFESVLTEYRRAPSITRKRLYLETMEKIYSRFEKLTIVDPKVKGVLPVFNPSKVTSSVKKEE